MLVQYIILNLEEKRLHLTPPLRSPFKLLKLYKKSQRKADIPMHIKNASLLLPSLLSFPFLLPSFIKFLMSCRRSWGKTSVMCHEICKPGLLESVPPPPPPLSLSLLEGEEIPLFWLMCTAVAARAGKGRSAAQHMNPSRHSSLSP